ncbi:hypothetical protein M440DRAFT_232988 [Trichoderma longibrachiatum ATCC 18648]|uniref:Uncharacterized protein n=1 Tax=Trichoderma longibrachiatum ATCC 18648 TaxID=983965 RepID=A0A2T4CCH1_TRILO|nr:hypothetical protein M440DRAFT_232988 [Trichoderma longibrachiatum ATCC 18648]
MKAGRQASCWRRHSSMCSGCLAATYILAIEKTVIVISVHVAPIRRGRGALKRHPPEARSSRTKSHTLTEMDAIDSAICEPGRAWLPCHHHQLRLVTNRMLSRSASVCQWLFLPSLSNDRKSSARPTTSYGASLLGRLICLDEFGQKKRKMRYDSINDASYTAYGRDLFFVPSNSAGSYRLTFPISVVTALDFEL